MFLIFIKNFRVESMIAYVYLKNVVWKFKEYHAFLSAG